MTLTDRQLLHLAAQTLPQTHFQVWILHHQGTGRRAGSKQLGITHDTWRHRLHTAQTLMAQAIAREEAA